MHLNAAKLKTARCVSLHQGHSNSAYKEKPTNTVQIPTDTKYKLPLTLAPLSLKVCRAPRLNSPITMTTTLSTLAVPVGGFHPAFSNFTLCGYLHSVITIPSILIFPVQTMWPGYTRTKKKKKKRIISWLCAYMQTQNPRTATRV